MSEFPTKIKIEWIRPDRWDERTKFRLLEDVSIYGVNIPSGFVAGNGIIPFPIRRLLNPSGKYFPVVIAYDFIFNQLNISETEKKSRFFDIMKQYGVPTVLKFLLKTTIFSKR